MRQPCLQCFRKHLGNAQVLLEEIADGYPYQMGVIGHLDQAAQEIRGYSKELANLVRAHRIKMQSHSDFSEYNFPFEAFDALIEVLALIPDLSDKTFPEIPSDCYEGLDTTEDGKYNLLHGDQR